MGGQPAAYWRLPFNERRRFHARPGTTVRDVSKVGLESPEKSDKVRIDHVRVLRGPQRLCEACGRALAEGSAPQRRFCSGACQKRTARERKGTHVPRMFADPPRRLTTPYLG